MKSYKRNLIYLSLLFFSVFLYWGCEDPLAEQTYSSVTTDNFYQNEQQAELALNGVYYSLGWSNSLYGDGHWTVLNDLPGATLQNYPNESQFDIFAWQSAETELEQFWSAAYTAINRANVLIDRLSESNLGSDFTTKVSAQAKFIRGLLYFDLVRLFGGVPLHTQATSDLSEVNKPRSSAEEIYQQIESDFRDAEEGLSPFSSSDHAAGRATSGAAKSLLAEMYIQQKQWQNAADKAKEVIDMGVYGLYEEYGDIFNPQNANGKENIFSTQRGNGGDPTSQYGSHLIYLFGPPPTSLPDGTSIEFFGQSRVVLWQVEQDFFDNTPDTYRKWMTMRDRMPYYYRSGTNTQITDTVQLNNPFVIKFNHLDISTGNMQTGLRYPVIRYSNILLMYAEALNEVNQSPPQAAYEAINRVRQRARAVGTPEEQPPSVYPNLSGLTKEQFRDSMLVEQAREFIGESDRRLELLRHDRFIQSAQERGFSATEDMRLFPIPTEQLSRNPELEQNPGY